MSSAKWQPFYLRHNVLTQYDLSMIEYDKKNDKNYNGLNVFFNNNNYNSTVLADVHSGNIQYNGSSFFDQVRYSLDCILS